MREEDEKTLRRFLWEKIRAYRTPNATLWQERADGRLSWLAEDLVERYGRQAVLELVDELEHELENRTDIRVGKMTNWEIEIDTEASPRRVVDQLQAFSIGEDYTLREINRGTRIALYLTGESPADVATRAVMLMGDLPLIEVTPRALAETLG